jgi:hypothetical protein
MRSNLPVTFFLAGEPDIDVLRRLDPDADYDAFRPGERSWVAQTYLRLRAAGWPVELSSTLPERGMVVFHAKHKHALARAVGLRNSLVFVAIRADNSAPLLADFEVLQTRRFADGRTRFHIPFWTQPGIRPRDPSRGSTITRVAYLGRLENLHPDFQTEEWSCALAAIGIQWVMGQVRFHRNGDSGAIDWEDYREIDAILAVRPPRAELLYAKPASKLVNAWYAGVPALVGPEYAFREVRRSEDDYLEIAGPEEALAALHRLQRDPDLYLRMVAHGRERVAEFSHETTTNRWAELLFETLPAQLAAGELPWGHQLPMPLRLPLRRGLRWLSGTRSR